MQVANNAFLGKSVLQVGPIGPLILYEHVEFDPMRRQIVETDLQDRSQQARSNPAPGVSDRYSPEPDALMGASDTLQDGEACDVGSIACYQISGGRIFDFGGMLLGLPSTDQTRIAFHALDTHDGWDIGFGRGLNVHGGSLALARLRRNAQGTMLKNLRGRSRPGVFVRSVRPREGRSRAAQRRG